MVKSFSRLAAFLLVVALVAVAGLMACTPTLAPIPQPVVTINSPPDVAELPADDVTVSISVSDFNIVQKLGESPTSGEGHIHYYMDAEPPTTPGQPAVTEPGTYAATTETSHTWENVEPGTHTFSVQLVNNNHTPLEPPVIDTVKVTIEAKQFSLVPGWYRNRRVEYYDFGANTPLVDGKVLTAPIYVFVFGTKSDGSPDFVPDQHNLIDVIPGDPGYSDLWQVNLVTVPSDYQANSIKAVSEIMEGGFTVMANDILVNRPVVPASSMLETDKELTQGWYKGKAVYYFDFGANQEIVAPIYALITGMDAQGNPQFVQGQKNIVDVVPGDEGYSAFWRMNLVTVPQDYVADTLKSAADVVDSEYTMNETDILVNCPVVSVAGESVTIDLSARNVAFDKSQITVPPGAMVTIVFTNNDSGIPHNFALYETQTASKSIYVGEIITGVRTIEYTFVAPTAPGTYFFRCDVHPTTMKDDFIVGEQEASSGGNGSGSSAGY